MPFGAEVRRDGTVRFRLWAPTHADVRLELDEMPDPLVMRPAGDGWHELVTDRARPGTRYRFGLPNGMWVPDPASRHQPKDVHGPSEVVDPATYEWSDRHWQGRPWEEAVLYELHIGAFTPEGTFQAAIGKLEHLVSLGVTALEIMPVGDFPGERNWGYDGVLPYAPDSSYGRPEDLKALIDAAHARGLMVLLDVVYNHFGPEGAYLHAIAPGTFTDRHKTPWGAAIDFDGPHSGPVREYFIHNALYWLEEFHLDGLRLDAVHAILDDGPIHLLDELSSRARDENPNRPIHLLLENEENAASRHRRGSPGWYTAQWNDDVHHVLHTAASGESQAYYADYLNDTEKLGRALAEGFAFQGEMMPYRGRERGEPSADLDPTAFVAFIQNHDQIGNRPFGDRLTAFAPAEAVRAVAAVYLLLPQIPMLFMGEEWGAAQPFPFFCDFGPELAEAVRKGRREEFARFADFHSPENRERIPDPTAEETFASAKLAWDDVLRLPHTAWLAWYGRLLAVRHAEIVPILRLIKSGGRYDVFGDGAVVVSWSLGEGRTLSLTANLSPRPVSGLPPPDGRILWQEGDQDADRFGPWAVRWCANGGAGEMLDRIAGRMGIEPEFRDAKGQMVRTSAATKRAVLAAMGVDPADEAALDQADWLNPLPPVQVVRADAETLAVDLILPAGSGTVNWRLTLEDGEQRSGRVEFGTLDRLAAREADHRVLERRRLVLEERLPWGYHRLTVQPGDAAMCLVVTPGRCWVPEGDRLWGIAAQLYTLRSSNNWGIGDFTDLRQLVELGSRHGAGVIGLNPLHAMFLDNPRHASPYSPASRLLLNILNIDVTAVPELRHCPSVKQTIASDAFRKRIEACRAAGLVDYAAVSALKLSVLQALFDDCRSKDDSDRWKSFQAFQRERGPVLEQTCVFQALREHFAKQNPDWHQWPEEYQSPASDTVHRFTKKHRHRLDFLAWTQFIADEQLAAVAAFASERGMPIGLYRDLAIGADRAGAETWVNPAAVVSGAHVGAPPDIYNSAGQDWGLPPFDPAALRREAYRGFIDLIRANMRHAGGLRIDHVMGLQRLFWVPQGKTPAEGAYVRYPIDDLVGILALESHRQHCLVVGEDLGTVPEGFRERMADANILSYRVLFFEQDGAGAFLSPDAYPRAALAVVGSHDLPTLRGWWEDRDLDLKDQLNLFVNDDDAAAQRQARERDRAQLLLALHREGLLSSDEQPDARTLARAVHEYLARTPALLAMAQIDDLTEETDPVNVPATSTEHPNWRRPLSMTLEELSASSLFADIATIFGRARGHV